MPTLVHASVRITDLRRSQDFYEGLLGFRQASRPDLGFPGAWYDLGQGQLHLIQAGKIDLIINTPSGEKPREDEIKIRSYAVSRWPAVSSFESFTPSRSKSSGKITAAATSGPASAPRPASSAPAIRRNPWARRPRS